VGFRSRRVDSIGSEDKDDWGGGIALINFRSHVGNVQREPIVGRRGIEYIRVHEGTRGISNVQEEIQPRRWTAPNSVSSHIRRVSPVVPHNARNPGA